MSWSWKNILGTTQDEHTQGGSLSERKEEEPHPKRMSETARQLLNSQLEKYFRQQICKYLVAMTYGCHNLCSIF